MWPSVKEAFGPFKIGTEGKIGYMYCDKNGYVTVGVGNLLRNAEEAKKLTWHIRGTHSIASSEQIEESFEKVKQKYKELKADGERLTDASKYKEVTHIRLEDIDLKQHFHKKLLAFEINWKGVLSSGWDTFPADAQMAILAISWKVGLPQQLKHDNWELYDAIVSRDFSTAAKKSDFPGRTLRRQWKNQSLEYMFTTAATVDRAQWLSKFLAKPATEAARELTKGIAFPFRIALADLLPNKIFQQLEAQIAQGLTKTVFPRPLVSRDVIAQLEELSPSKLFWPKKITFDQAGKLHEEMMSAHPPGEKRKF